MVKKYLKLVLFGILLVFAVTFVSAWDFYGYVYDVNGTALYNATINITFWTMNGAPTLVGSNASESNETGWFNFSVHENESYSYKPVIRHFEENTTDESTPIDYVGQSLPWFPFDEFNDTTDINFYLREAGTINITAVNATGSAKNFYYQVKDTKLGYPIDEDFDNYVSQKTIYLPRGRNYSVMIYPNESMPVSFDWNNFSASSSYNISTPSNNINLSNYNHTTHTLHKQFNVTENLVWVSGYALNSTGGINDYDEFTVVPFILEPGNMVYLGDEASMPYNMSYWRVNGTGAHLWTDNYSLSTGFYNITLSGSAEAVDYILFATARNGSDYYGGYRNISLNYTDADTPINFTMYSLMGVDWNTSTSNITMNDASDWSSINISSAKQAFNLVNATTNETLETMNAHIEVTVDYSDYNCTEFTFMMDIDDDNNGTFYLPLINATGVKEMNIYSNDYAPKRVGTMTAAEILANNNISMAPWNPRAMEEEDLDEEDIFIEFYKSNSDCDVPNPDDGCKFGGFGPDEDQNRSSFSPLSAIIGGGKLSFRMGYGGIKIHYVNVDMLASGPPDVAFDSAATESRPSGGSFSSALRFGSMGPTIYDHVLVSIPYTEGNTSTAGLDESEDVNMSLPLFYTGDDVDTLIWDTSTNGTNATLLAGNYSHYSAHSSEWETLMGNNTCVTDVDLFNATNPCYVDTTNDRIWIRIPHFDGNSPSISGSSTTVAAAEEEEETTGGGGTPPFWTNTYVYDDKEFSEQEPLTREFGDAERVRVKIDSESHYVGVISLTSTTATINISSTPQQATLAVGDVRRFDVTEDSYYDIQVTLNSIADDKANITIKSIYEEVTAETIAAEEAAEAAAAEEVSNKWIWIIVVIIVILIIIGGGYGLKKRREST